MKISYVSIIVLVVAGLILIFPNFFYGIKGKVERHVNSQYSVEIFEQKSIELRKTFIKLTQRINIIDAKIDKYKEVINRITTNYTQEAINSDIKLKSKINTYSKIINSYSQGRSKLEELRVKIKKALSDYDYNIEILKNKEVLKDSLKDINSYLKEFNIDSTGLNPENINNILDESIIEEEAILKAFDELEEIKL